MLLRKGSQRNATHLLSHNRHGQDLYPPPLSPHLHDPPFPHRDSCRRLRNNCLGHRSDTHSNLPMPTHLRAMESRSNIHQEMHRFVNVLQRHCRGEYGIGYHSPVFAIVDGVELEAR